MRGMSELRIEHFDLLRAVYGNHSNVAKALGTTASHYAYIRKTVKASGAMKAFILHLCQQHGHQAHSDA